MTRSALIVPALLLTLAAPAAAQLHTGVRAGVSSDPNQFFFGGHVETQPLLESLTFRPNVELGLGDNLTVLALNVEFVYSIPLPQDPWRVYLGGGPAANLYSVRGAGGGSSFQGGFNLLVGAQHAGGLFTELKVGAMDSPNLKFTVGYAFRPR